MPQNSRLLHVWTVVLEQRDGIVVVGMTCLISFSTVWWFMIWFSIRCCIDATNKIVKRWSHGRIIGHRCSTVRYSAFSMRPFILITTLYFIETVSMFESCCSKQNFCPLSVQRILQGTIPFERSQLSIFNAPLLPRRYQSLRTYACVRISLSYLGNRS